MPLGDLLTPCSIKWFERGPEYQWYEGQICFRGDNVKDEYGAVAVCQEVGASPTAVQGAIANIAFGCLPGHSSSVSNAHHQSLCAKRPKVPGLQE